MSQAKMESTATALAHVKTLLETEEVIEPTSKSYAEGSRTWAAYKNLKPQLVVRPKSVESLSGLIAYLNKSTNLDFAVRCGGVGSSSAKDLLISLSAFDGFEFNEKDETITIGAGQVWGTVDQKMERHAPGYAAVSTRCTYVGVSGSVLHGGISWLSSEYGLASDPQNMLDAQVIKRTGQVIWASEEPDLLWALRGGGGGFAVVTALKLKVYNYPTFIYSGQIQYPREALPALAKATEDFAARCNDPKMALHLYCLDLWQGAFTGREPTPGVAILVYDANGERHGRSSAGFKWALDIEGAVDMTKSMTLREVNEQGDGLKDVMGMVNTYMSAAAIPAVDEQLILRAWNWFEELLKKDQKQSAGAFVLIEVMQPPAFQSVKSGSERAWPNTSCRHMLQLGTGAKPGAPSSDEFAEKSLSEAPYEIDSGHKESDFFPNFLTPYNDPAKVSILKLLPPNGQLTVKLVYGKNFGKLQMLKKKYDPEGKLKGPFMPQAVRG